MEPNLDVLVWDDSFERVRVLYKKYPGLSIRKAISGTDFIVSLDRQPTLIIIGKQVEYTPQQLADILSEHLTEDTTVLIWKVANNSAEISTQLKDCDHVQSSSGFSFDSPYLWISIVNILK